MKNVVIIQARMGSERFPGKVLADLAGKPVLQHVIDRCNLATLPDKVVVATSWLLDDNRIYLFCRKHGISCFPNEEFDVLTRVYLAAREYGADNVVRVNADCPLIDPADIDELIDRKMNVARTVDYIGYQLPDGKAAVKHSKIGHPELITTEALGKLIEYRDALSEHVTYGAYTWPPISQNWIETTRDPGENNTIDYPEDIERIECSLASQVA